MHRLIREAHAHIDDDSGRLRLKYCHVPADLTQTTQWRETYLTLGVDVDLLPRSHSGFLNTLVLFNGCTHCVIYCRDILAFIPVLTLSTVSVLVVVRFSVLIIVLVILLPRVVSSVLAAPLSLGTVLSVRVGFTVVVGLSVGVVPLSVLALCLLTLRIAVGVGSVLSMWVGSSVALRLSFPCFWPLILRVFVVCFVVFHLNYPLIHCISDDK